MKTYMIRLTNCELMSYEQNTDHTLVVEPCNRMFAETFSTYESAKNFALAINNRKDGNFTILSPEDAMSILEIDETGNKVAEYLLLESNDYTNEYIVNVTKEGFVGYEGWEENIYLATENGLDYEEIFEPYVNKKIKITIEVL